jgi:DNA-binding transcriptional regulator WhiA
MDENIIEVAYKLILEGDTLTNVAKTLEINRKTLSDKLFRQYGYMSKETKRQLERSMINHLEVDEIAYEMYCGGESLTQISKKLGVGYDSLCKRLFYRYGVEFQNQKSLNPDYFKEITAESAYWLGYIQGDGCISNGIFEMVSKDKEHMIKFKTAIKSEHKLAEKIVNGESYWRIGIARKDFVNSLSELGIMERKSYCDTRFNLVTDDYIFHYLRGFFDADGSISQKGMSLRISFTVSKFNNQFTKELIIFLNKYGLNPKIYQTDNRPYEIKLSTKDSYELAKLMYSEATIYLKRKHNIFKRFAVLVGND